MKKLIALTTFIAMTAPAFAQDETFVALDADADGAISMEELMVAMPDLTEADYAAADTDGDGSLSEEEFLAYAATTAVG